MLTRFLMHMCMLVPVLALLTACATGGGTGAGGGGMDIRSDPPANYKVGNPYKINGRWYYPQENPNYDQIGVASWYGPGFHAKRTANGEVYDMNGLTAAHTTLPMPSYVRVTNVENNRSLILRVNDRGPFARGRIIDVSRRAAQLLGFESKGTARVRVQVVAPDTTTTMVAEARTPPRTQEGPAVVAVPPDMVEVGSVDAPPPPPSPTEYENKPMPAGPVEQVPPSGNTVQVPARTQVYVQAGAFTAVENANRLAAALKQLAAVQLSPIAHDGGQKFYRVRLGPLASVEQANALLSEVVGLGHGDARIVVD